jgi:hypothetical protein
LLYQIHVKILAQGANATHVLYRDDKLEIRLPYLVEINRDRLAAQLGGDVRVTRTAVELRIEEDSDSWRDRALEVLEYLATSVRQAVGM